MNLRTHPTDPWLRTFLIIFTGQGFSLLGSAALNFALVWWLTAETGSAATLAHACLAALLPQALLGPFVGPFVDRWDRRRTMIGADLFIAATSLLLLAMFAQGRPAVAAILGVIALRSAGAAFHQPASQAAVPMYVPPEQLLRVAGWNFFLGSGVAMAGPVLGAFLMGVAPMGVIVMVDVVGAVVAVVSLLLVRIPHPQRSEAIAAGAGLLREFREGWRELIHHRGLLQLTAVITMLTLLYMPLNALFPLMTFSHFGGDALRASIAEFAFGSGMLAGSLAIGTLSARITGTRLIASGVALLGVTIGAAGLLPSSGFWVYAGLCILMGVSAPLFSAPLTALFQTLIDPAKLGRVMSLYMTTTTLMAAAGLVLAGPVAERIGVAAWFAMSGVLILLAGIPVWVLPAVRRLDRMAGGAGAGSQRSSAAGAEAADAALGPPQAARDGAE